MITEREQALWQLLDDIDTASDIFKPEMTEFYNYVMGKAEERHKHLTSDGFVLSENEAVTLIQNKE